MRSTTVRMVTVLTSGTLAVGILAACSNGGPAGGESSTEAGGTGGSVQEISIAQSVDVLDASQAAIRQAIQKRVDELNQQDPSVHITFEGFDAQNSVQKQISDVQTLLLKKPDVLLFSAVDSTGSLPAMQAAHDAGVKIIDMRPTDPEPDFVDVAYWATNEDQYSKGTTDWIQKWLTDHPDQNLKIGLIYGAAAQTPQLIREDAIKALADQMPDRIQIVATAYGDWATDKAQNITQDWLQAHPDINYISCANDVMALGVANALASANLTGKVMVSGYDLNQDGIERLQAGTQDLDVGVDLTAYSTSVDVAVKLMKGTFSDHTYKFTDVQGLTPDTVDAFLQAHPDFNS